MVRTREMKLRRGLFRLWLVVSVAWSSASLLAGAGSDQLYGSFLVALTPWAFTALALGLRWAYRGFVVE